MALRVTSGLAGISCEQKVNNLERLKDFNPKAEAKMGGLGGGTVAAKIMTRRPSPTDSPTISAMACPRAYSLSI